MLNIFKMCQGGVGGGAIGGGSDGTGVTGGGSTSLNGSGSGTSMMVTPRIVEALSDYFESKWNIYIYIYICMYVCILDSFRFMS